MNDRKLSGDIGCRLDEVQRILREFGLEGVDYEKGERYRSLLACVRQLVFLRIAGVGIATVRKLWEVERKLIEMIHGDSHGSPSWLVDGWGEKGKVRQRLFLTRYAIGADVDGLAIQEGLNFSEQSRELFEKDEMGEDVLRLLEDYTKRHRKLSQLMGRVQPLLQETARWAKQFTR